MLEMHYQRIIKVRYITDFSEWAEWMVNLCKYLRIEYGT